MNTRVQFPQVLQSRKTVLRGDFKLQKHILIEGSGSPPMKGNICYIKYTGWVQNEEHIFDSNQDQISQAFKVILGKGQVIRGIQEGLLSMKQGQKSLLYIHPDLAFGTMGVPPQIPGSVHLSYMVTLIKIEGRNLNKADMQKLQACMKLKELGNQRFKQNQFQEAQKYYKAAIQQLQSVSQPIDEAQDLEGKLLVNLSITYTKLKQYSYAYYYADKALTQNEKNMKALYNRAIAGTYLELYQEAEADFKKVLQMNPSDTKTKQEYEKLKIKISQGKKQKPSMTKGFLDTPVVQEKKPKLKIHSSLPQRSIENPRIFLDIQISEGTKFKSRERIICQLFKSHLPKTVENFRALCTGQKGPQLYYKGCPFHRVIPHFVMQGGDITHRDGTGGKSIYGDKFQHQHDYFPHSEGGLLGMANMGNDAYSSQFYITFEAQPHLDRECIVFGRVVKGMDYIRECEKVKTSKNDQPVNDVKIVNCGQLSTDRTS